MKAKEQGKGIPGSGRVCTKVAEEAYKICSVNAETSGRFGKEAVRLGAMRLRGLGQDSPGAAGGVREACEHHAFHSSELASQPLPERKMQEKEHRPGHGAALQWVGCVLSASRFTSLSMSFLICKMEVTLNPSGVWRIWQDVKSETQ